ncbi:hypothetical protein HPB52_023956 [Rhipicephalus sanguineus]|uniref:Serpin domain-containing protein n=1 Tax=Rhipicephalus sanguineus TaxID=34632 RepID=A0A9D4T4Q1_RHISA|nr:hypothetical protein HPB52_023956 [Rhipicephalus sanguineus]
MRVTVRAGYARLPGVGASLLELPYTGLDYSMVILLPENTERLESFRRGLSRQMFEDAVSQLRETTISVLLPRFKMEEEYELKELLPMLGIKRVFDAGQADLSGINGGRDLHVDRMVHKAVVEFNEEGSEAAAVTGAAPRIVSGPILFNVNHSFLFFIRNTRTGDIIFVGVVNDVE